MMGSSNVRVVVHADESKKVKMVHEEIGYADMD
jgi:hypothetical protein